MGFEGKPTTIKNAALDGNKEALSAMGKKGAEVANKNRADKKEIGKIQSARIAELKDQEEQQLREATNEHIIDADGNDLDYTPE